MKIRWREHEILLFTLLTCITILGYLLEAQQLTSNQIKEFQTFFSKDNSRFNLFWNRLFPQIGSLVVLYICYLWINRRIIPYVLHSNTENKVFGIESKVLSIEIVSHLFPKKYIWGSIQILLISCLLAIGINVASYFAHPHYFNYGGFSTLAWFGYNDHPLTNLFFGLGSALLIICIYLIYVAIREFCIHFITKNSFRSAYHILVTNQITMFVVAFVCVIFLVSTFNLFERRPFVNIYFSFVPTSIITYLYNTYGLFPLKGKKSIFHLSILPRLVLLTLILSFLFSFLALGPNHYKIVIVMFFINFGVQLLIITPISWLLYQQKEERILQLRGVEKELTRSKADLQFLRSQINPHFLFNALNTLYGTALLDGSERTAEGIQKLGDMMRFMLHENNQDFIAMNREIEYLQNYISLQKLRIQASASIEIEDSIDSKSCDHEIAPMLLIPFVENAFKHGISLTEKSWIKIKLECKKETIRFEVRNSMHPHKSTDPEKEKSGIGLKNVLERLALLYTHKHLFKAHGDGNEFVVELVIQP